MADEQPANEPIKHTEHAWQFYVFAAGDVVWRCEVCGQWRTRWQDARIIQTEQQLAQVREEIKRLTGQRDALQEKNHQLDERCVDLYHEQERLREELKKANTAMFDMRDVIGKEEQTIATLRGEIDRLHLLMDPNKSGVSAVLAANREMESLHQQLHEAQRDFSRMAEERVKQNEAAIKQDETIEFLHIVIDDVKAQNAAMRALLEALTATEPVWESDTGYYYCLYCEPGIGRPMETFQHKDDCPWLKAGALLGKEEER